MILGTEVNGHFFADSAEMFTIQYIPRAGIRLVSVTPADSGTYSVHVHTQYGGHLDTTVRSANVVVTSKVQQVRGTIFFDEGSLNKHFTFGRGWWVEGGGTGVGFFSFFFLHQAIMPIN